MISKNNRTKILVLSLVMTCTCMMAGATSYQYGDKGGDIPAIQKQLKKYGYKPLQNGKYDKETKWAVRLFQKDHGLPVDGIVGPQTYKKIMGKNMPAYVPPSTRRSDGNFQPVLSSSKDVNQILQVAQSYRGVPYVFGGTTPSGFDCSGYTRYVFAKAGINLPRMADEQYGVGVYVPKGNLRPGDLVFFETYTDGVSHSGIYIGNDKFISATSSRGVAVADINDSYWGSRYVGARRIIK